MRLIELLKKKNIGSSTLEVLYEFLSMDKPSSMNDKITETDFNFIEKIIDSEEFNNYFRLRQQLEVQRSNMIKNIFENFSPSSILNTIEKKLIFNHILSEYKRALDEDLTLILDQEKKFSECNFEKLSNWYWTFLNKKKEIGKKYKLRQTYDNVHCIDDEEIIMRALGEGTADRFGFE